MRHLIFVAVLMILFTLSLLCTPNSSRSLASTSIQRNREAITAENIDRLTRISSLGDGEILAAEWLYDNETVYLSTITGLYRFDSQSTQLDYVSDIVSPTLALSRDNQWLFLQHGSSEVVIWDLQQDSIFMMLQFPQNVSSVAIQPRPDTDNLVVLLEDGHIEFFVMNEFTMASRLDYATLQPDRVEFRNSGNLMVLFRSQIIEAYTEQTLWLIDLANNREATFSISDSINFQLNTVEISASGEFIAINGTDTHASSSRWDITRYFDVETLFNENVEARPLFDTPVARQSEFSGGLAQIRFSQGDLFLACYGGGKHAVGDTELRDTKTGAIQSIVPYGCNGKFSPDGAKFLPSANQVQSTQVVDTRSGDLLYVGPIFTLTGSDVLFGDDNLLTILRGTTVFQWDYQHDNYQTFNTVQNTLSHTALLDANTVFQYDGSQFYLWNPVANEYQSLEEVQVCVDCSSFVSLNPVCVKDFETTS